MPRSNASTPAESKAAAEPSPAATSTRRRPAAGRRLAPDDFVALARLRYALRRFTAFSETAAAERGLTPQQHQALLAIKAAPGETMTVGEIAEWLLLRPHSAGELVDRLERMALVRRQADESDRRRVRVALTRAAQDQLDALSAAHFEELRAIGPMLRQLLTHFESDRDG
ncbi:MarR family transcriptional regulator [Bordetella genomosp. 9]|uniref:MarR family winged helix-turn-helix transcriptional regulator n=1 Tax=Bordetella genomosp. 9 TaxID=1416803 RepID=UPI000A294843|nr:MarR family transcriptional regulator [Bordetella genomosp. 9]ARP90578.1 MarR family transcriptional regulator [Bordetella genomosp. 9]